MIHPGFKEGNRVWVAYTVEPTRRTLATVVAVKPVMDLEVDYRVMFDDGYKVWAASYNLRKASPLEILADQADDAEGRQS